VRKPGCTVPYLHDIMTICLITMTLRHRFPRIPLGPCSYSHPPQLSRHSEEDKHPPLHNNFDNKPCHPYPTLSKPPTSSYSSYISSIPYATYQTKPSITSPNSVRSKGDWGGGGTYL